MTPIVGLYRSASAQVMSRKKPKVYKTNHSLINGPTLKNTVEGMDYISVPIDDGNKG